MTDYQINFIRLVSAQIPFNCSFEVRDFIACQIALESAFGESAISHRLNNFTGMRCVVTRLNNQCKQDNCADLNTSNFGYYASLYDCLIDYGYWLAYNKAGKRVLFDLVLFKAFLIKHKYCPEPDYIIRITNLLNSYKNGKS